VCHGLAAGFGDTGSVGLGYCYFNFSTFHGHGLFSSKQVWLQFILYLVDRDTLRVHPQGNRRKPLTGVFLTRSPDRPNPLGLHRAKVLEMDGERLRIGPIEAIDGTPVLDIKPVVEEADDFLSAISGGLP
jgi:tRNA-Thr(GGU) m(6)t(6)A37 methyltransferase TsaA